MHDNTMWLIPLSLIPGIAILIISTSLKNNQARSEIFQLIMENKDLSVIRYSQNLSI